MKMRDKTTKYTSHLSGVGGVAVLWAGITVAMRRAGLHFIDPRPISYLGVDPQSAKLFSGTLILSAIFFVWFGIYIKRTFQVKGRFLLYLVIGQIGQIIAAIAPYGKDSAYRLLHTIAAFTLAFSLPFLIGSFASSQRSSRHYSTYKWLFRFELVAFVVGIGLFIFTKGIAPLGEALPALGFHIWIIAVTFFMYKEFNQ